MNVRELLLDVIAKATGSRTEISEETNLIQFGLSSLQVMKIAGLLRKSGIKVSFADLMEYKTFGEWVFFAESKLGGTIKKDPQPQVQASDQAFPLTDVQYSYWVGRGTDQPMGGVDCHAYYEFEGKNVNAAKLKPRGIPCSQHIRCYIQDLLPMENSRLCLQFILIHFLCWIFLHLQKICRKKSFWRYGTHCRTDDSIWNSVKQRV